MIKKKGEFCQMVLYQAIDHSQQMIFSDEAYFPLTQQLIRQNNRIWANEKLSNGLEYPLYDQKVSVFCAISSTKVYGSYFFRAR